MTYCRQLTSMALTLGVLLAMACGESPVTPTADLVPSFAKPPGAGGGGGGGPNSGTPLSVALTGGDVTGDGLGLYVDGADGVMAIIDQNDDLKFDVDAPKKNGVAREICFNLGTSVGTPVDASLLPDDPTNVCGGPLWNTRGIDVELSQMVEGGSGEFGSRFIVTPNDDFEYKVRYGADELACPGLSLPAGSSSGVSVIGGPDTDGDTFSDSWTLDATDRVAFVSARDRNAKGKNTGFECVGIYAVSWGATLAKN